MNKKFSILFLGGLAVAMSSLLYSCEKDYEAAPAPVNRALIEDFDTVANLYSKGWAFVNNSRPQGAATWQQGVYAPGKLGPDGFPAFSYRAAADEYAFAGFASGDGVSTLSSWMLTPELQMRNGDKFSFFTRTFTGSTFPDRMEVRMCLSENTTDVGRDANSVGKYTTRLTVVNPNLQTGNAGYPQNWTKVDLTIAGLPEGIVKRRIAFRYFVTNGGPSGANSNAIGIDLFHFRPQ
ncbi:MAG TPA: choice-of-anchor J domain-containing protein [Flavisolibacter sp.]|nr:choice-of-anchor J domain-containing protein [Flavisolibacter sp.]